MNEGRSPAFYALAAFFALYVLFLYGPMIVIFVLSFQGPTGGLTFPLNGLSLHWFHRLWVGGGIVDISGAFKRSLELGLVVMVLTVVFSLMAGLAFRKRFLGANLLFYVAIGSIFVVTIVMGDFITFDVMGGEQIASAGKVIETRLGALQFPPAAANAVILLGATMLIIAVLNRIVDIRKEL